MRTRLMFCCVFIFTAFCAPAQNDNPLNSLQQQFNNYQQQAAQEKIYLHVDKSFFLAGEILWFKVYAVDAFNNAPTQLSKVAYVEVVDAEKKPVLQAKIKLSAGSGSGSFQLPTSARSGNYIVRAYTNWMKNFSAELYFSQNITIVNTLRGIDGQKNAAATNYDIRFFPEGGNLVSGIRSKVAFRIINQSGKGMDCSGAIVNQNGTSVAAFKPLKFGIGSFSFTPLAGDNYTAVIAVGGETVRQTLPVAYSAGYTVHVDDTGGRQLKVNVASSTVSSSIYLLVTSGKEAKAAMAADLLDGKAIFSVEKAQLGDGINHFTVFDNNSKPVCERLYFKKPKQYLQIDAAAGQDEFNQRQKITVDINTKDEAGAPQMADMSMSVYKLDSLQQYNHSSIEAYLFLNADLRGTIEQPDYYFSNNDAVSNEALDNLMLTHGWSRYTWNDITQNKLAGYEFLPELEGHIVIARITDKNTGKPAENILAYLSTPGKNFRFAIAKSKGNGLAQFNVKDFVGGDAVILQTNQTQDSTYRIDIVNPFSEKFPLVPASTLDITEKMQNELLRHSINTQVQNAYYSEKNRQFYSAGIDTLPFFGHPSNSYLLDDYTRFTTMEEVLREYVPEVAVRRHRDDYLLKVADDVHNQLFDYNPLVLADGVPFFNMDTVIAFNPLKIRKLDVVTNKYYLGTNIFYGIVSYTTYNGDLEGIPLDPASLVLEYEGMQLQREFYMPKYDTPKEINSRLPDFRDVLCWTPEIKTDEVTGKTQTAFYTSDLPGNYVVVINGITATGKAGSKTFFIKVK